VTATQPAPERKPVLKRLDDALASGHLPMLDGLRAVAVSLVIFYHFGFEYINGAFGVEVFFVLSGFLITWLLLKEDARSGDISIRGFYVRRFLRIFPAFYVYWMLGILIEVARGRQIPYAHAISAFFYYSNYYGALVHPPPSFVSHTWSLAVEEQFYILWPVLFWLLRKPLARFAWILAGIIAAIAAYRVILALGLHVNQGYIYRAFDTRADHLLAGALLAVVLKADLLKRYWEVVCGSIYLSLITFAAMAASAYADLMSITYRNTIGFAIEPLLIATFIVQLFTFRNSIWKFLDWPVVAWIGRVSYSLYLYQELTLFTARRLLAAYPVPVQLAFGIFVTLVFAFGSYFFVELPFLKIKDRIQSGKPIVLSPAIWKLSRATSRVQ
jgi:peptidoglycan/LPS O-acetylase OafA/YrhL